MFETSIDSRRSRFTQTRRYFSAFVIPAMAFGLATGTAKADCATMLAPLFSPPADGHVAATVTKQYAYGYVLGNWTLQGWNSWVDPVKYGNGTLPKYSIMAWPSGMFSYFANTISGTIDMRTNASTPLFAPSNYSINLAINTNGQISILELINGNPIGGVSTPTVYQGVCSAGLITVVDKSTSWVISLGTYRPPPIL